MVRTRGTDRSTKKRARQPASPPRPITPPSGPRSSSLALAPLVSHPLSQFGSGTQRERSQILSTLCIHLNYAFNLSELNKVGLGDSVLHILRISKWELFVQIDEPSYMELLLEFLATFSFEKKSVTFDKLNTVQFWLGNQRFSLSLTELSIHYGFYSPDFTSSPDY